MIRPITDGDWPRIEQLEAAAYAGGAQAEDPAALRSRAAASPGTCFVLGGDEDAGEQDAPVVVGYLLALPYPAGRCPDLARPEHTVHHSTNLHLHDLVVAPAHRRRGLGRRAVEHLTAVAARSGWTRLSLCAVAGTDAFWAACGFRPQPWVALPPGYGAGARYLTRLVEEGSSVA